MDIDFNDTYEMGANTNSCEGNDSSNAVQFDQQFIIGLTLAISSSVFIGSSFILKKKGLLKVSRTSSQRAGKGGYAYLKEWLWWAGLLTMGVGEGANFISFGFIPAALVTILGALSVLVGAVLSTYLLDEKLNLHGKLGCFLCIIGASTVVIHAPTDEDIVSLSVISKGLLSIDFIVYAIFALGLGTYLMFFIAPRHGETNLLVYISICSLFGSLSVVAAKGMSIAIRLTVSGNIQLTNPLFWILAVLLVTFITIQMNFLNKSLDTFNTSMVTPIYYVMFTSLTITSSAILFKEWQRMKGIDVFGMLCGFMTVICGVFLIHWFKDVNVTFSQLLKKTQMNMHSRERLLESQSQLQLGANQNSTWRGASYHEDSDGSPMNDGGSSPVIYHTNLDT